MGVHIHRKANSVTEPSVAARTAGMKGTGRSTKGLRKPLLYCSDGFAGVVQVEIYQIICFMCMQFMSFITQLRYLNQAIHNYTPVILHKLQMAKGIQCQMKTPPDTRYLLKKPFDGILQSHLSEILSQ